MTRARAWAVASGAGVAIAFGAAWLLHSAGAPAGAVPQAVPSPSGPADAAAASARDAIESSLVIRLVRDGAPIAGHVDLAAGQQGRDAFTGAFPLRDGSRPCDGALELAADPARWYRIRGRAGRAVGFALVPPGTGRREAVIALGAPRLHVLLLESDLRTPAAGAEVRIAPRPAGSATVLSGGLSLRTDVEGLAHTGVIAAGNYLVAAPGAHADDGYPYVQPVMIGQGAEGEQLVTVVVPEPRVRVRFAIEAALDRRAGRLPKLFLERVDDGSGDLYPVPGVLQPGSSTTELRVPPGTFRLGTVPMGEVLVAAHCERLEVSASTDHQHQVRVAQNDLWTEVRLRGVGIDVLPVRIGALEEGSVNPPNPDLVYCGPLQWANPVTRVRSLPGRRRLVGSGRGHALLAREAVVVDGAAIEVDMVKASRVQVRWETWSAAPAECVCVATTSVGEFARTFRRLLANDEGSVRPTWALELFVPLEPFVLVCLDASGVLVEERRVTPVGWRTTVRIQDAAR